MKQTFILVASILVPATAFAQTPRIAPHPSVVFAPGEAPATPPRVELPETYWQTGAIIGGVGVGILGASAMYGLCGQESNDCQGALIGGFVIGALVGGVSGAMIGGLIPKTAPAQ